MAERGIALCNGKAIPAAVSMGVVTPIVIVHIMNDRVYIIIPLIPECANLSNKVTNEDCISPRDGMFDNIFDAVQDEGAPKRLSSKAAALKINLRWFAAAMRSIIFLFFEADGVDTICKEVEVVCLPLQEDDEWNCDDLPILLSLPPCKEEILLNCENLVVSTNNSHRGTSITLWCDLIISGQLGGGEKENAGHIIQEHNIATTTMANRRPT